MKQALLYVLALLLTSALQAQTGTEFWLAPPEVTSSHGDQPIFINVTTLDQPAVVTISQPANPGFNGGTPIVLNLAANTAQRYDLTSLKVQLETRPTNTVLNTGLRISATASITLFLSFVNPLQAAFTVSNACAGSQTVFTDHRLEL